MKQLFIFLMFCSAVPLSAQKAATTKPAVPAPQWHKTVSMNKMDGSEQLTLSLHAKNADSSMVIRCREGQTELYVITPRLVDVDDERVRLRYDNEAPFQKFWAIGSDHKSLFVRDSNYEDENLRFGIETVHITDSWISGIADSKRFMIEYHPVERIPEIIEFNVSGLKVHLPEIAKACKWDQHDRERAEQAKQLEEKKAEWCKTLETDNMMYLDTSNNCSPQKPSDSQPGHAGNHSGQPAPTVNQ